MGWWMVSSIYPIMNLRYVKPLISVFLSSINGIKKIIAKRGEAEPNTRITFLHALSIQEDLFESFVMNRTGEIGVLIVGTVLGCVVGFGILELLLSQHWIQLWLQRLQ